MDQPIPKLLQDLLDATQALPWSPSDLFLRTSERPMARGPSNRMAELRGEPITTEELHETLEAANPNWQSLLDALGQWETTLFTTALKEVPKGTPKANTSVFNGVEITTVSKELRLRLTASYLDGHRQLLVVLRLTSDTPHDLTDLGLSPFATSAIQNQRRGSILLVTGPTGAGKSTTMYAAVMHHHAREDQATATIEDPIETTLRPARGVVFQRQVRVHPTGNADRLDAAAKDAFLQSGDLYTAHSGVRGALRMAVQNVMVMEVRDGDTALAVLDAAESGMRVIAGIHAADSIAAIERFLSLIPGDRRAGSQASLADRLHAVVYQQLLRSKDANENVMACETVNFRAEASKDLVSQLVKGDFAGLSGLMRSSIKDWQKSPTSHQGFDAALLQLAKGPNRTDAASISPPEASAASRQPAVLATFF